MAFNDVLSLLGGLALFLFGMRVMSENLERVAGPGLRKTLRFMTRSRVSAVLAGTVVTGVVQSSSATTVMVVGFVNAGMLTLNQAAGVIMGANIGTTVTALMLSVKINLGAAFAIAGMLLSFLTRTERSRQTGYLLVGLGVLFTGMNLMTGAMEPLRDFAVFRELMLGVTNPLLAVALGAGITAVLQSSSASVGILQALAAQGLVAPGTAFYILLGTNIGTCVTALIVAAGSQTMAKRAATVHFLFNLIGTALFMLASLALPIGGWIASLSDNAKMQIALAHVLFNVSTTLVLLPFIGLLTRLSALFVPARPQKPLPDAPRMTFFDERLLATPAFAAQQLYAETARLGETAAANFERAMDALISGQCDQALCDTVEKQEELCDFLNEKITQGLVDVKALELSAPDNRRVGACFHVVNDFERVSDHAMNLRDLAKARAAGVSLSEQALAEMRDMRRRVSAMLDTALEGFRQDGLSPERLRSLELFEQEVDDLTRALRGQHIARLQERACTPQSGVIFLEALTNLERVADHAMNVAALAGKKEQGV